MKKYLKIIKINEESMVPKYRQLADAIVHAIEIGQLAENDGLPSLHDLCTELDISKNSVEKAYDFLRKQGIVASFKGKGFYVASDKVKYHMLN